jgi:hypothetical protein
MSLKNRTPHTGKHAKVKAVRPVGLVSKARSSDVELAEEFERVKALVIDLAAGLDACGDRLDVSLSNIDLTLQSLAAQKERIQVLERGLGIER